MEPVAVVDAEVDAEVEVQVEAEVDVEVEVEGEVEVEVEVEAEGGIMFVLCSGSVVTSLHRAWLLTGLLMALLPTQLLTTSLFFLFL